MELKLSTRVRSQRMTQLVIGKERKWLLLFSLGYRKKLCILVRYEQSFNISYIAPWRMRDGHRASQLCQYTCRVRVPKPKPGGKGFIDLFVLRLPISGGNRLPSGDQFACMKYHKKTPDYVHRKFFLVDENKISHFYVISGRQVVGLGSFNCDEQFL